MLHPSPTSTFPQTAGRLRPPECRVKYSRRWTDGLWPGSHGTSTMLLSCLCVISTAFGEEMNCFCRGLFPSKAQADQQLRRPRHQFSWSILRLIRLLNQKCDWDSYCQSRGGQQTDDLRRIASRACRKCYLSLQARPQKADRLHLPRSRLLPLDRGCVRDCVSDRLWQSVPPSIGTVESIKNLIFRVYWALNGSAEIAVPVKRLVALLTRSPLQGGSNRKCAGLKSVRACSRVSAPLWPSAGNLD